MIIVIFCEWFLRKHYQRVSSLKECMYIGLTQTQQSRTHRQYINTAVTYWILMKNNCSITKKIRSMRCWCSVDKFIEQALYQPNCDQLSTYCNTVPSVCNPKRHYIAFKSKRTYPNKLSTVFFLMLSENNSHWYCKNHYKDICQAFYIQLLLTACVSLVLKRPDN